MRHRPSTRAACYASGMVAPTLTPEDRALLSQRVRALAPLPDGEWRTFLEGVTVQPLETGEHFLRQGDHARFFALVSRGLVREYYSSADGVEFTRSFCPPGSATGSLHDLLSGEPAITSIQALEPTRLLRVPYAHFEEGCARFPLWHQVARRHAEALFVLKVRREYELLTMPARQRYAAFRERLGELEARIPQRHIASHLGITPEHLSRVRRQLKKAPR
jgi:CRP-like cAMP-binding protein